MARVKTGPARRARHKKIRKATKGMKNAARRRVKAGKEALLHQGQYQYIGRKLRKRDFRKLWIIRLNAAVRKHDLTYSRFIKGLKDAKIELDRKTLSEIAIADPKTFTKIVDEVKKAK